MPKGPKRGRGSPREPAHTFLRGATWWARFQVAGREFRGTLSTGDAAVARRRAREWHEREIGAAKFGEDRKSYIDVFEAWSAFIVTHVGPETAKRYLTSLRQIESHLKPRFFDEIDREMVSQIVRDRRAAGVTTATIRRDLSALSGMIEFAIDEGWRPDESNPALSRLKRLKEVRDPIVLPLREDIDFVIGRTRGNFRKLIEAAVATGCRQDELVKAERRLLDRDRLQLTIRRKGNQIRTISLSEAAWAAIGSIPAHITSKWLFYRDVDRSRTRSPFGEGRGEDKGDVYKNVAARFSQVMALAQKAAQKDGREFRPFTFHHLRHFYAVMYLKNGGNIYALQQHLNHKSITTTELYLKFLTSEEAMAAKHGSAHRPAQGDGAS